MAKVTALLHTNNDALRLGRCLETLYACDDVVIVDHNSQDRTVRVAHEYGARIVTDREPGSVLSRLATEWIFCLDPRESMTEALAATLYEWKAQTHREGCFSICLREETADGWISHKSPLPRLVSKNWGHWQGNFPAEAPSGVVLEGDLLRFAFP
ncbi:MAG TPA: hypothetical protein VMX38_21815 [Verrucomicrobiae bacterium]|jgi:glycosyltransferase involved in cell wall biosynthesis|nr:hypothetical protein [Verrucomicrobiae bacterium]